MAGYKVYVQEISELYRGGSPTGIAHQRTMDEMTVEEFDRFDDAVSAFENLASATQPGNCTVFQDLEGVGAGMVFRLIVDGVGTTFRSDFGYDPTWDDVGTPGEAAGWIRSYYEDWRDAEPGRSLDS